MSRRNMSSVIHLSYIHVNPSYFMLFQGFAGYHPWIYKNLSCFKVASGYHPGSIRSSSQGDSRSFGWLGAPGIGGSRSSWRDPRSDCVATGDPQPTSQWLEKPLTVVPKCLVCWWFLAFRTCSLQQTNDVAVGVWTESWCYYPNQHICQRGCRIFIAYSDCEMCHVGCGSTSWLRRTCFVHKKSPMIPKCLVIFQPLWDIICADLPNCLPKKH